MSALEFSFLADKICSIINCSTLESFLDNEGNATNDNSLTP